MNCIQYPYGTEMHHSSFGKENTDEKKSISWIGCCGIGLL